MSKMCCGEVQSSHRVGPFLGRLLLSLIFVLAGLGKIFDFEGTTQYFRALGITQAPSFFVGVALLFELIGGLLVLVGWYTRLGCIILMIFLVPATLLGHAFWNYTDTIMQLQFFNFTKNIALYGALILLISYGPGRWSVDALCTKE